MSMADSPALSVVIPAYNEEQRLPSTLDQVGSCLAGGDVTYEIIVADDGSADGTAGVVAELARNDDHIRLLVQPHRGKGSAVRGGVLAARGSRIVFCDADLPVDPTDIIAAVAALDQHDVVIATREEKAARRIGEPYHRHLMGRLFNVVTRLLAVPGAHDTQCGLKAFRADAAHRIFDLQSIDGFGFDVELLFIAQRLGHTVRELPVVWTHRPSSRVSPLRDSVLMMTDVLRVRFKGLRGEYGRSGASRPAFIAKS